jgi:hypothetical protein
MERAAGDLGVEPRRLTALGYDSARLALGIELSSREITQAWGGWRIARATLVSGHGRETAQQRALRKASQRGYPTHESYFEGVRVWLASDPPRRTLVRYDEWARAHNARRSADALPFASYELIRRNVGLSWSEILRVATGEIELAKATHHRSKPRTAVNLGARHDLMNTPLSRRGGT